MTLAQTPGSSEVSPEEHLRRAHAQLAQHRPEAAVSEFQAVLSVQPDNLDAAGNLGVLLYFSGKYTSAEPLLRQALTSQSVPKLQALLGLCERRNGNFPAAIQDLGAALPKLGEPAIRREAGLELVELESGSGDLAGAAATVSALKAKAPDDPGILYAAYRIYTDLAGEAMLDLSLAAPASAEMHQAMAHELLRERDVKGAIANYREALVRDPNLPGGHYELAEALRSAAVPGLKAEAEQQYQLALKQNPHDVHTMTRLAGIAVEHGEHANALNLYQEAHALAPSDIDAGTGLAHELVEKGDTAAALPILQRMEAIDPTDVLVHFRLSALYRRMNRPDDAKREVAMYEKYKAIKEKMRTLYQAMRLNAPTSGEQN